MRIAILEDDPDQLALLNRYLSQEKHDVHGFLRGREMTRIARRESFDLFILDWQVPDLSGIEVLRFLRGKISQTVPVLFTTVRDTEEDIVSALNDGADDYMIKPIRRQELLARVNALLRRAYPVANQPKLLVPPYEISLLSRELRLNGKKVDLTLKEFELAVFLFRNVGRLISRTHLLEAVWGKEVGVMTRTVDTHISQLRRKLNLGDTGSYRLTPVYNYGYRLEAVATASPPAA